MAISKKWWSFKLLSIILRFIVLAFYSSLTFAQGFVFVGQHKGESAYVVAKGELKSRLIFPFEFQAIGVGFDATHQDLHYIFEASTLTRDLRTTAKDYDWKDNQLTFFSSSNSDVKNAFSIGVEVAKDINKHSRVFVKTQYHKLNLLWSGTKQQDFTQNKLSIFTGDTLSYRQNFYQVNLGLSYQYLLSNNISLGVKPSIIFAYVKSVDKHLLRDFYTVQNNLANGYGVRVTLDKSMSNNGVLSVSFNQESYQDQNSQMNYYPSFASSYSLPASYKHHTQELSISYQQQF